MTVESCFTNQKIFGKKDLGKEEHKEFLKGMTLCNDGVLEGGERIGDPTDWLCLIYLPVSECSRVNWKMDFRVPRSLPLIPIGK